MNENIIKIAKFLRKNISFKQPEIFINLTYKCPLRCKFCYVDFKRRDEFTLEDLEYIFEEGILKNPNIKLLTFFGGEPLSRINIINHLLQKYYKVLCESGIHIAVITSFSINTDKYIEIIKNYPLLETVISFDYNVGDRVLANNKPFKVLDHINLEELKKYNNNICFHTVIVNEKSFEDLLLCQEIYEKFGFLYSWCWNKTPTNTFIIPKSYKVLVNKIIELDTYYPKALTDDISFYFNKNNLGCGIGGELYISANGDISPCSISHHNKKYMIMNAGNINEESYENIQDIEENIFNNDCCKDCDIKGFCNGGCLIERLKNRNNFNSVNPSLCNLMKQLYNFYDDYFKDKDEEFIKKIRNRINHTDMTTLEYCYDTSINIDMNQYKRKN